MTVSDWFFSALIAGFIIVGIGIMQYMEDTGRTPYAQSQIEVTE